jgi:hypothetical protein
MPRTLQAEVSVNEKELQLLIQSTQPTPVVIRGRVLSVGLDGRFRIVSPESYEIAALAGDTFPLKELGFHLGREVMISGAALHDRHGRLVLIIGNDFSPLETIPLPKRLPGDSPAVRAAMAARMKEAIGKWPGAQSDEEEKKLAANGDV